MIRVSASAALVAACAFAPPVFAQIAVDARSNIFGATHAEPPQPGLGGAGLLPPVIDLTGVDPNASIIFPSVTGMVTAFDGGVPYNGPDGRTRPIGTNVASWDGISGILHPSNVLFLVGVFAGPGVAADPAPPRLDLTGMTGLPSFEPLLHQTFFIGDGLTGTGSGDVQTFKIPAGATRLFLGFVDGYWFGTEPGQASPGPAYAGSYDDNAGALSVTWGVVPTPGPVAALGLAGLLGAARRRR